MGEMLGEAVSPCCPSAASSASSGATRTPGSEICHCKQEICPASCWRCGTRAVAVLDQCRRSQGEAGCGVPSASQGIVGGSDWSVAECC